jgi:hypothetical protein
MMFRLQAMKLYEGEEVLTNNQQNKQNSLRISPKNEEKNYEGNCQMLQV